MFLLIASVTLAIWAAVFMYKRRRLYELASLIPSIKNELPVIGVTHMLVGNSQVLVNPKDVEVVLKTNLEKDDVVRFIRDIIGNGSTLAPVPIWRRRRRILVPAFKPQNMEDFVEVFSEQSSILVKNLEPFSNCGEFDIWPRLMTYSLDSVCETVLGVKVHAQSNPDTPFLESLQHALDVVCKRMFHVWLQPECVFRMFPCYSDHRKYIKILHDFTDEVIRKRRLAMKSREQQAETDDVDYSTGCRITVTYIRGTPNCSNVLTQIESVINSRPLTLLGEDSSYRRKIYKTDNVASLYWPLGVVTATDPENCTRKSFLDLLMSLSGGDAGYTDVELREEVLTLIIAGSDTSAIAMANTLLLMAKYPIVQDKVYNELCEVFDKPDRLLVKEDLKSLKYLEMVVKESLRLYPPLPFVTRKIETETVLPSGNILPAGCGVVVSLWGAHRDPKYWGPNAEHFNPERFLPNRMESLHPCSYIPFSSGPRNCLGYQYALMSIKTALASILRRYKVVGEEECGPVPQIPFKIEIMMKTVDGYQIKLETRN